MFMDCSSAAVRLYTIYADLGIVSVQFAGELTLARIREYAESLHADSKFNSNFSEMVDLRLVDEISLSPDDLMNLADRVDLFSPQSLRAFVAKDPAQIHVANIHRILRTNAENIRVFASTEDALSWILGKRKRQETTQ